MNQIAMMLARNSAAEFALLKFIDKERRRAEGDAAELNRTVKDARIVTPVLAELYKFAFPEDPEMPQVMALAQRTKRLAFPKGSADETFPGKSAKSDTIVCDDLLLGNPIIAGTVQGTAITRYRDAFDQHLPLELQQIQHGGFTGFIGLFVNDGYAMWRGFDFETKELIEVERYAGDRWSPSHQVESPTDTYYSRSYDDEEYPMIDVIQKRKMTLDMFTELIDLTYTLWACDEFYWRHTTDIVEEVVLIDGDTIKKFSAPGSLYGTALLLMYRLIHSYSD
jgi:hypothetical protein